MATEKANPLWGGRFNEGPAKLLERLNSTVETDFKLFDEDVEGSISHAEMLAHVGVLTPDECSTITTGLRAVADEFHSGRFRLSPALEDVHMNIESRLHELVGDVAGKLHTGRSRNDQIAVDSKRWTLGRLQAIDVLLSELVDALCVRGIENAHAVMPGFTHLQNAQPVTLGHYLLAYAEMFYRDRCRFADQVPRAGESPLGAAALAGTSFPIDRHRTASELGFSYPMRNSIDAVSDRDFMLEYMSSASIAMIHISRFAEELVVWSSEQFDYVALPENLTAGSSIMPQKRNPDLAELIRAKSGRVVGDLVTLLMVMKALPLAYSRDMQEDKEPFFDCVQTLEDCVDSAIAIVRGSRFKVGKMREDAQAGSTLATDVADWLVREKGVPFRRAHHIVGSAVKSLQAEDQHLNGVDIDRLRGLAPELSSLPTDLLSVDESVKSRRSHGGTSPTGVQERGRDLQSLNNSLSASSRGAAQPSQSTEETGRETNGGR